MNHAPPQDSAPEARDHWHRVYRDKRAEQTSWHRPHLDESLRLIDALDLPKPTPVIDVGAGRSTLVDDLLARGFTQLTALDLAEEALADSRARLGPRVDAIHWLTGDITQIEFAPAQFSLWHDRAVFHFLAPGAARDRYIALATRAIAPGGYALIATFASDGPERCSGLPVQRYDHAGLAALFPDFTPIAHSRDLHTTPAGNLQPFTCIVLRRNA